MGPGALAFDVPVLVVTAVACLPIFFNGRMLARWEGALFLAYYAAYTAYLVLAATQTADLRIFSNAMLFFVIPLTVVTLLVITVRNVRQSRQTRAEQAG